MPIKPTVIFLLFFITFSELTYSQFKNIKISPPTSLNTPHEPSVVINPKNTKEIMICSNYKDYFFSNDGGLNWKYDSVLSTFGMGGNPCVLVDNSEQYYYFHISTVSNVHDRIVCQKISHADNKWTNGTSIGYKKNKIQDKPWAVLNNKNNNLLVTWTQFDKILSIKPYDKSIILFSKSDDSGEKWSEPIQISKKEGKCSSTDSCLMGAMPATGINGEIYISWASPYGIMFNKSTDNGVTWLKEEIKTVDLPKGLDYKVSGIYRCTVFPVINCDLSNSKYKGTIYISWTDQRNGVNDADVFLIKSTDNGKTWTKPVKVNDDTPGKQQFMSWMTIDQVTGYLYFVFYDRRNYNDDQTDVYLAVSKDGGKTFKNIKISETPFIPSSYIFLGDNITISAYNNIVRPVWTRLDNFSLSIWTAIIDNIN